MKFHQLILIGLFIIIIDIRIETLDIVPDVIGYIIFASAFSKIPHPHTGIGVGTSILLAVYSIYEIFVPYQLFSESSFQLGPQIIYLIVSFASIVNYVCIFSVSRKIVNADDGVFPKIFIGSLILYELFLAFFLFMSLEYAEYFALLFAITLFVLHIYFIIFIWKRKNIEGIAD